MKPAPAMAAPSPLARSTRRLALRLCTALAASALPLAPALSQGKEVLLDEVVFSALRTAAEIARTGMSVTVIDREALEADSRTNLTEILAATPGLSMTQSGPFGNTASLRIRGLGGGYVAVFIDGIRVDDPSTPQAGYDFGSLLASDVGRVEILRGSQSALWGTSAVGGVVSITTLGALEAELHQQVGIEGGTYGTYRLSYGLTQSIDRLDLALNLTRFHTDGFSAAADGTEKDGADASRISLSARYRLTDQLAIGASAFAQNTDQDYDDGYGPPPGFLFGDSDSRTERRERGARLFAEYSAGATEHVFDLSWYDISRRFITQFGNDPYDGERLGAGWQATTTLSPNLTLVYGLDWTREKAASGMIAGGGDQREVFGVFGQGLWSPTEQIDVSLALRADHDSDFGTFVTGRLAGAWQSGGGTTVRGAIARGYRAPTIDERFASYPFFQPVFGNPDLDVEQSWSYELGFDHRFASGASLSATLFRIEIDNKIDDVAWGGPGTRYENLSGTTVSKGIELSGTVPLSATASLGFGYTHTDAREANGNRLLGVPRNSLMLSLDGRFGDRLSAGLRLRHIDGLKSVGANSPYAPVDLDPFTLFDAQVGYDFNDRTSLYLRVENLTDQKYTLVDGYGTAGRSVHVGLKARF